MKPRLARNGRSFGPVAGCARAWATAAALAVVAVTSGCAEFSYVSATYVGLQPQVVTIGCNEPYEVYDQRQKSLMMIVSNGLSEHAGCGLDGVDPVATRGARIREAARTYLDETAREDCTIVRETPLAELRTEFAYACAAPVEKPGTKVPRLPGRY